MVGLYLLIVLAAPLIALISKPSISKCIKSQAFKFKSSINSVGIFPFPAIWYVPMLMPFFTCDGGKAILTSSCELPKQLWNLITLLFWTFLFKQ